MATRNNIDLEKFYTKSEVAKFCIEQLDLSSYERVIEPSAGNGSFSNQIECEAYDLAPENDKIIKQDFFEFNTERGNILVIGNPPFGRQSNLAIKFINHAALFAKTIAFVLPKSFSKESVIKRLDKHLHLKKEIELPKNSFYYKEEIFDIPCKFYIFEYSDIERKEPKKYKTTDFEFTTKENADYSIRRVGFNAGKIEGLEVSKESHYFIKDKSKALDILSKINYSDALNTAGPKSLSKQEIIKEYERYKKNSTLYRKL